MRKTAKKFAVLTFDIVNSRKFDDEKLLGVLHRCLEDVNEKFATSLLIPLKIVLGDTIQCVCRKNRSAYDIFQWLEELLWLEGYSQFDKPVMVRCGIGIGKIENSTIPPNEMNGEAFRFASKALESQANERDASSVAIIIRNEKKSELLTSSFGIVESLKKNWNRITREIVLFSRDAKSQIQVANKMGISRMDVKNTLDKAGFKKLLRFEKTINRMLATL
ncbi:hypothetical protein J7L68_07895 [bacterium]|nr:hypothetical protein [bacterium]